MCQSDPDHELARKILDAQRECVTHISALTELIALANARRFDRTLVLRFAAQLFDSTTVNVVWLSETDHRESLALLQARPDKRYSLCDAASFVLMRRLNIREALTTDRHFEQEGFVRLLK